MLSQRFLAFFRESPLAGVELDLERRHQLHLRVGPPQAGKASPEIRKGLAGLPQGKRRARLETAKGPRKNKCAVPANCGTDFI